MDKFANLEQGDKKERNDGGKSQIRLFGKMVCMAHTTDSDGNLATSLVALVALVALIAESPEEPHDTQFRFCYNG